LWVMVVMRFLWFAIVSRCWFVFVCEYGLLWVVVWFWKNEFSVLRLIGIFQIWRLLYFFAAVFFSVLCDFFLCWFYNIRIRVDSQN
jgi:hypothetical protein